MKTWVKVLLGGCLILLVGAFVAVFVAVRWFQSNKDDLMAKAQAVRAEGREFGRSATAAFEDGRVVELRAGELFYIPPEPHDSWVVGDEPYVSLHFLNAAHYAK